MARSFGSEDSRANEAGFALVALMAALPLLIVLLVGLSLVALALKNRTSAFATCRWSVFQAQTEISPLLQRLIALNPKARTLRLRRMAAEAEVKAATATLLPPLITAAQAHRLAVVSAQMQLRAEQENLLLKAAALRARARQEITGHLQAKSGRVLGIISPTQSMAVKKVPAFDLTPDHIPAPFFERQQVLQFHWQQPLFTDVPEWLLRAGKFSNLKLNGECAATIYQENKKWIPRLVAAKSSPK